MANVNSTQANVRSRSCTRWAAQMVLAMGVIVDLGESSALARVALFRGPERLDYRDPQSALDPAQRFGDSTIADRAREGLTFQGALDLSSGTTYLWVAVSLAPDTRALR